MYRVGGLTAGLSGGSGEVETERNPWRRGRPAGGADGAAGSL